MKGKFFPYAHNYHEKFGYLFEARTPDADYRYSHTYFIGSASYSGFTAFPLSGDLAFLALKIYEYPKTEERVGWRTYKTFKIDHHKWEWQER